MRAILKNRNDTIRDCKLITELTFEVATKDMVEVPEDIELKIEKHFDNRGKSANAKYWSVVGEIASLLNTSKIEVHNQMLIDYGCFKVDAEGKPIEIIRKDNFNHLQLEDIHLFPTTHTKVLDNGITYRLYYQLKDSKDMNSKEFSKLIDGAIYEWEQIR